MRSFLTALLLVVAMAFVTSGCYRHSFRTGAATRSPFPDAITSNHHVFWGFANLSGEVHAGQYCPQGTAMIKNRVGVLGVLISIITAGVWVPTTIEIWCAAGGVADEESSSPDLVATE